MGTLESVLSGAQQAAQANTPQDTTGDQAPAASSAQPTTPPLPTPTEKPDVPGFQGVLKDAQAAANPSPQQPVTPVKPSLSESDLRAAMKQNSDQQTAFQNPGDAPNGEAAMHMEFLNLQATIRIAEAFVGGAAQPLEEGNKAINELAPINVKGENEWISAINEWAVRPMLKSAAVAALTTPVGAGLFTGFAGFSGTTAAVSQAGEELHSDRLKNIAEVATDPGLQMAVFHSMPIDNEEAIRDFVTKPPLPPETVRAVDNGIAPNPTQEIKTEAMERANAQAVNLYSEQARLGLPPTVKRFIPEEQTIHDVVRQENPALFNEYDSLTARRDFYRQTFNDLLEQHEQDARDNVPHNEEIAELQAKMQDANTRKAKIYQEKIDDLTAKNEDYVKEQMNPLNFSEDIKNVRGELAKTTERLGHMEGDVKNAYLSSSDRILPKVETVPAEIVPTEKTFEPTEGHLGEFQENPSAAKEQASQEAVTRIAGDVEQKLKDAGRPPEEANAQAQVVGSFFNTMSKIYPEKGTAEQIYQKEKPRILTGKTGKVGKKEASLAQNVLGAFRSATDKAAAIIKLAYNADATTFMHESAHHFFDIIHRYAQEEGAPQRLKDDYKTMREWMGIPEGADAYHRSGNKYTFEKPLEKFARGFETYLKEGRAPSKDLAGVFAKFKTWITDIYNTLRKTGQPISEDIRGVFDRMLAEKPERTVIAPDHEPGKMAADIHETDAQMVGVGEHTSVGDNIEREMDATAKLHKPEVADAIKTAETQGVTEPPASNPANATAAEQRPGHGSAPEESGTKPASGSEPTPAGVGGTKSKPAEQLFDKAGNLIPKNLTNSDEVIAAWKKMASDTPLLNNDVVPDVKVAEAALSMGVKEQELNLKKMRRIFVDNDIPLATGMRALTAMAERVMDEAKVLAEKVKNGTLQDEINLMENWKTFKLIGETLSGTAHEAGLLLRSFRGAMKDTMEGVSDLDSLFQTEMGMTRDQVKRFAAALTDKLNNRERAKLMSDSQKPGFAENISSALRFNTISGAFTHWAWLKGTAINTLLLKPLVIDAYAGLENRIGMGVSKISQNLPNKLRFNSPDTGARILGGAEGLYRALAKRLPNILSNAGYSIRTGKTVLMPFEDTAGALMGTSVRKGLNIPIDQLKAAVDEAFKPDAFPDLMALQEKIESENTSTAQKFALGEKYRALADEKRNIITKNLAANWEARDKTWRELYDGMGNFATSMAAAVKQVGKNIVDYSPKGQPLIERRYSPLHEKVPNIYVKGVPVAPIGTLTEGVARPVASVTHAVIREFAAAIESKQKAVETAAKEGLKGEELSKRAAYLVKNPTPEMWKSITEGANEQTFMQHGGVTAEAMVGLRRVLDKWSMATVKAPLGSMIMPVAEIPANVFGTTVKKYTPFGLLMDDQRGLLAQWGREGAIGRGKMLAGTGLLALGFWMGGRGDATPSRPASSKEEETRKMGIGPSDSVRMGNWWIDVSKVPVIGKLLTLGADLHHLSAISMGEDEGEKLNSAVGDTLRGVFMNELSIFQLADVMDAMEGRTSAAQYLNAKADMVIPQYMSQAEQLIDPIKRDTSDFWSSLQARVPGGSFDLAPRINPVTGDPVEQNPLGVSKAKDDPIALEYSKIGFYPANPKPVINDVPLSPQQSAEFSSIRAHILYNGMQDLTQGAGADDYNAADIKDKRKLVEKRETHATDCAKSVMFNKYPELLKDANDKYEQQCRDDVAQY